MLISTRIFIKLLVAVMFFVGCVKDLSEPLSYTIKDNKVIFEFSKADLEMLKGEDYTDLDEFKELIKKRLSKVDSIDFGSMEGWQFVQVDSNLYRLEKSLSDLEGCLENEQKMMFNAFGTWQNRQISTYQYAYQEAWPVNISEIEEGEYQFFLPGFKEANSVILSGSFNKWNTIDEALTKTDSGWVCYVPLGLGKHAYKYIVDGQWTEDPFNDHIERNEHGSLNSIVVISNYAFELEGYDNAKKVVLSADFVSWDENAIKMRRVDGRWLAPIFLREGVYAYKFIVDGNWILDPLNEETIEIDGHINSLINLGKDFTFKLKGFSSASQVFCAGSFNSWDPNALAMVKTTDGWECTTKLPKGNYEFKYIVDGEWLNGGSNGQILVENEFGELNNFCTVGQPYLFELKGFANAKEVIIAGTFNNWNEHKYKMRYYDGAWHFPFYLPPGKHLYKFIVDGIWMTDPTCTYSEANWEGTYNSVLWLD